MKTSQKNTTQHNQGNVSKSERRGPPQLLNLPYGAKSPSHTLFCNTYMIGGSGMVVLGYSTLSRHGRQPAEGDTRGKKAWVHGLRRVTYGKY
ncbi:hypothetical protein E2C01_019953 [Portunus trituberculatus]|uniref:Uncharacterized protein n=1 Tax=Portunus trituberculatus TaxID=210409 RepID=A0A5B7E0T2_PORTR|nr:hypothetical protein [Portunus trituberculatus]